MRRGAVVRLDPVRPRALLFAAALIACAAPVLAPVGAQTPPASWVRATGRSVATLALQARADVAPVLRLALPVADMTFDLTRRPGQEGAPACLVGSGGDIVLANHLIRGPVVAPGGTDFRLESWPSVRLVGGGPLTSFPPDPGATDVVCYGTFLLGTYANEPGWQLLAARIDPPDLPPVRSLYIAAACEGDAGGGLVELGTGGRTTLVAASGADRCRDVLVVLAVKVGPDAAGTSATVVRYTLLSPDADFDGE
jgi:hypothetical protein